MGEIDQPQDFSVSLNMPYFDFSMMTQENLLGNSLPEFKIIGGMPKALFAGFVLKHFMLFYDLPLQESSRREMGRLENIVI